MADGSGCFRAYVAGTSALKNRRRRAGSAARDVTIKTSLAKYISSVTPLCSNYLSLYKTEKALYWPHNLGLYVYTCSPVKDRFYYQKQEAQGP